jgi:hypothetical protein
LLPEEEPHWCIQNKNSIGKVMYWRDSGAWRYSGSTLSRPTNTSSCSLSHHYLQPLTLPRSPPANRLSRKSMLPEQVNTPSTLTCSVLCGSPLGCRPQQINSLKVEAGLVDSLHPVGRPPPVGRRTPSSRSPTTNRAPGSIQLVTGLHLASR